MAATALDLPAEVLVLVFEQLRGADRAAFASVCVRWRRVLAPYLLRSIVILDTQWDTLAAAVGTVPTTGTTIVTAGCSCSASVIPLASCIESITVVCSEHSTGIRRRTPTPSTISPSDANSTSNSTPITTTNTSSSKPPPRAGTIPLFASPSSPGVPRRRRRLGFARVLSVFHNLVQLRIVPFVVQQQVAISIDRAIDPTVTPGSARSLLHSTLPPHLAPSWMESAFLCHVAGILGDDDVCGLLHALPKLASISVCVDARVDGVSDEGMRHIADSDSIRSIALFGSIAIATKSSSTSTSSNGLSGGADSSSDNDSDSTISADTSASSSATSIMFLPPSSPIPSGTSTNDQILPVLPPALSSSLGMTRTDHIAVLPGARLRTSLSSRTFSKPLRMNDVTALKSISVKGILYLANRCRQFLVSSIIAKACMNQAFDDDTAVDTQLKQHSLYPRYPTTTYSSSSSSSLVSSSYGDVNTITTPELTNCIASKSIASSISDLNVNVGTSNFFRIHSHAVMQDPCIFSRLRVFILELGQDPISRRRLRSATIVDSNGNTLDTFGNGLLLNTPDFALPLSSSTYSSKRFMSKHTLDALSQVPNDEFYDLVDGRYNEESRGVTSVNDRQSKDDNLLRAGGPVDHGDTNEKVSTSQNNHNDNIIFDPTDHRPFAFGKELRTTVDGFLDVDSFRKDIVVLDSLSTGPTSINGASCNGSNGSTSTTGSNASGTNSANSFSDALRVLIAMNPGLETLRVDWNEGVDAVLESATHPSHRLTRLVDLQLGSCRSLYHLLLLLRNNASTLRRLSLMELDFATQVVSATSTHQSMNQLDATRADISERLTLQNSQRLAGRCVSPTLRALSLDDILGALDARQHIVEGTSNCGLIRLSIQCCALYTQLRTRRWEAFASTLRVLELQAGTSQAAVAMDADIDVVADVVGALPRLVSITVPADVGSDTRVCSRLPQNAVLVVV